MKKIILTVLIISMLLILPSCAAENKKVTGRVVAVENGMVRLEIGSISEIKEEKVTNNMTPKNKVPMPEDILPETFGDDFGSEFDTEGAVTNEGGMQTEDVLPDSPDYRTPPENTVPGSGAPEAPYTPGGTPGAEGGGNSDMQTANETKINFTSSGNEETYNLRSSEIVFGDGQEYESAKIEDIIPGSIIEMEIGADNRVLRTRIIKE